MQESREVVADWQFTKSALTFYIKAARHALLAANLPQFRRLYSRGRYRVVFWRV